MRATKVVAEPTRAKEASPCEICGKISLPYGFTQNGHVCTRKCSDEYDKNKYMRRE